MSSGEGSLSSRMSYLAVSITQCYSSEIVVRLTFLCGHRLGQYPASSSSAATINDRCQVVRSSEVAGGNNHVLLLIAGAMHLP
jgi:hypothetical protein